jgi:hypothetical protein
MAPKDCFRTNYEKTMHTLGNFLSASASANFVLKQAFIESQNDLGSLTAKLKRSLYLLPSGKVAADVPV